MGHHGWVVSTLSTIVGGVVAFRVENQGIGVGYWHPAHEGYHSGLEFTLLLLQAHRDMFSCRLHIKQGKSEGFDSWDWPSNLTQIGFKLNHQFFVLCDLEIWGMTLKNNRAPHLCCFKLCASFHNYQWIQTQVAVWKHPIWVKICYFCPLWPWNLTDDLEKQ